MSNDKEPSKRGRKRKDDPNSTTIHENESKVYLNRYIEIEHLPERWKKVITEVFHGKTRTQAALDNGFSKASAARMGSDICRTVAAKKLFDYLYQLRYEAEEELVQKWKIETAKIAFTDRTTIIEKITKANLFFVPFADWPEDVKACVKGVKKTKDGGVEVLFESKTSALESLGKHLGVYDADNRQKKGEEQSVKIYLPDNGRSL